MKGTMKRMTRSMIALLLSVSMVLGMTSTAFATEPNGNTGAGAIGDAKAEINYVSLGDSMTNGYGLDGYNANNGVEDYGKASYANQFAEELGANHAQLAMSAMRAEDLHWLLEVDYADSEVINVINTLAANGWKEDLWYSVFTTGDYYTWNELVNDYRFDIAAAYIENMDLSCVRNNTNMTDEEKEIIYDNYSDIQALEVVAKYYQESVADADVISLGIGNGNFGVFMFGRIMEAVGFGGTPADAMIYDVEKAIQECDPELQVQLNTLLAEVEAVLAEKGFVVDDGKEETSTMEALYNTLVYATISYALNYAGSVEAILKLNPDAEIVQVALMNTVKSNSEELADLTLGGVMDLLFKPLNMYIAGLPTAMQVAKNSVYADAEFYYAEAPYVECIVDTYDKGLDSIVRDRFFQSIVKDEDGDTGMVWSLLGDMVTSDFTLEDVEKYEAMEDAGKVAYAAVNKDEVMSIAMYLAFEKAIVKGKSNPVSVESIMGLSGLFAEGSNPFGAIMEKFYGAVKTPASAKAPVVCSTLAGIVEATLENQANDLLKEYDVEVDMTVTAEEIMAIVGDVDGAVDVVANNAVTAIIEATTPLGVDSLDKLSAFLGKDVKVEAANAISTAVTPSTVESLCALLVMPEVLGDVVAESELSGLLALFARCVIGNGIGSHPSATGHAALFEAVNGAYKNHTAADQTKDNLLAAANKAAELVAEYYDDAYAYAYAEAKKAGYIDEAVAAIDAAIAEIEKLDAAELGLSKELTAELDSAVRNAVDTLEALKALIEEADVLDNDTLEAAEALLGELGQNMTDIREVLTQAGIEAGDAAWKAYVKATEILEKEVAAAIEKLEKAVAAGTAWLLEKIEKAYNEFVEAVKAEIEAAKDAIPELEEVGQFIYDWLYNNPDKVIGFFNEYGDDMGKFLADNQKAIFAVLGYVAAEYGEDMVKFVMENGDEILEVLVKLYNEHGENAWKLIEVYLDELGVIEKALEKIEEIETQVKAEVEKALNQLYAELEKLEAEAEKAAGEVKAEIEKAIAEIEAAIAELEAKLAEINAQIEALIKAVEEAEKAVKDFIEKAEKDVKEAIADVKAAIKKIEAAIDAVNDAAARAAEIVRSIEAAIEKLGTDVAAGMEAAKAIVEDMKALVEDLKKAFAQFEEGFKDVIEAIDVNVALTSIIESINKYASEKIEEAYGKVKDAVVKQLEKALDKLDAYVKELLNKFEEQVRAEIEKAIAELEAELAKLKAEADKAVGEAKAKIEKAIAEIEKAIAELEAQLEAIEAKIKALQEAIAEADKAVKEFLEALNNDVKSTIEAIETFVADIKAAAAEIEECLAEVKAVVTEAIEITKEVIKVVEAISEYVPEAIETIENIVAAAKEIKAALEELNIDFNEMYAMVKAVVEMAYESATNGLYVMKEGSYYLAIGSVDSDLERDYEYSDLLAKEIGVDYYDANISEKTAEELRANFTTAYAKAIEKADLITLNFSNNVLTEKTLEKIGKGEVEIDWSAYVGKDGVKYIEKLLETINNKFVEGGMGEFAPLMTDAVEAYAHEYVSLACNYIEVVNEIKSINEDVQIVLVGMYNPFANAVFTAEGTEIALGEYVETLVDLCNAHFTAYAMYTQDVIYVEAPDVEVNEPFTEAIALDKVDSIPEAIGLVSSIFGRDLEPSEAGHVYIKDQILDALKVLDEETGDAYNKILALLDIEDINADNLAEVKALVEAAREAFDKLDAEQKAALGIEFEELLLSYEVWVKYVEYELAYNDNTAKEEEADNLADELAKLEAEIAEIERVLKVTKSATSSAKVTNSKTTVKASWKKVEGADEYKVELYRNGLKYSKLTKTVSTLSCSWPGQARGVYYKVKVTPIAVHDGEDYKGISKTSASKYVTLKHTTPKLTVKKSGRYQKLTAGDMNSTGYQVRVASNKKFTKGVKTYKFNTSYGSLNKKLKTSKYFGGSRKYVKVRAYTTINGKTYYGNWSSVKTVKK